MRDEFTQPTKSTLALRVNYHCSNPDCGLVTVGPHTDDQKSINKGVAAHIAAAAPGGKRYDASMTPEERSSVSNGIWLCQNCAKLIDSDEDRYPVSLLKQWKRQAEASVLDSLESNSPVKAEATDDVRVNATYGGGLNTRCYVNVEAFNTGPSPIYLAAWFARWKDRSGFVSIECIRGELPKRLQEQDSHQLFIDVGHRQGTELEMIGLLNGQGESWNASEVQVAAIAQQAARYDVLSPAPDLAEIKERLEGCEIQIEVAVQDSPNGKRLEVTFTNKSESPLQLCGCKIKWRYDPPRQQPRDPGTGIQAAQVGGEVGLASVGNLAEPVAPQASHVFFVEEHLAACMIETLLGDVKDEDIEVSIGTDGNFAWGGSEPELASAVREIAQHMLDIKQK